MTQMMPTTEIAVSITDQDLMVCPTVRPKYSLTSQKPGVVDVAEEERAATDGEHQQRDLVGRQVGRDPLTMPRR